MNVIVVFTNPGHLIVADILDLACERDIASNPEDIFNIQLIMGRRVSRMCKIVITFVMIACAKCTQTMFTRLTV